MEHVHSSSTRTAPNIGWDLFRLEIVQMAFISNANKHPVCQCIVHAQTLTGCAGTHVSDFAPGAQRDSSSDLFVHMPRTGAGACDASAGTA